MSEAYELVVLGTSSRVATRQRNCNGYLLRLGGVGVLFDPGEGTQRQLALANAAPREITHIVITHFHADHCLGLPGLLQRISLEGARDPVEILYPAGGERHLQSLLEAFHLEGYVNIARRPIICGEAPIGVGEWSLSAEPLDHSIETLGYRISAAGKESTALFAFVMDSRPCEAAIKLARGAELLVCESTYLNVQRRLAHEEFHMTAPEAAELARSAGAGLLLLTHFSHRHEEINAFLHEARPVFDCCDVARDLTRTRIRTRAPAG
jgi:ribonuclease Z